MELTSWNGHAFFTRAPGPWPAATSPSSASASSGSGATIQCRSSGSGRFGRAASTCPATTARACCTACPSSAGAGTPSPCAPTCWRRASPGGSTSNGASTLQRVAQRCLELVLERMEQSWPEGAEHYAKLAINSLVGLFARNLELIYSMKTSNHQVDGEGCSWRQTFTDAAGGTHWDHVFVTELLSNSSYRPVHDYVMGAEYVAVARIRQALAEVPRRHLKCIKTDCLVMQDVPKKYRPAVERLLQMSHRDGTPVYRYEEVTGLKGQYREPSMEAEPIRAKAPWRRVEDPVAHCLDGESLLLTGFPGTGKTHLAKRNRRGSAGARGHGAHHHEDPCGRAERGPGGSDGGPLGAAERPQRPLQRHLAGHRRTHSIRYSVVG